MKIRSAVLQLFHIDRRTGTEKSLYMVNKGVQNGGISSCPGKDNVFRHSPETQMRCKSASRSPATLCMSNWRYF